MTANFECASESISQNEKHEELALHFQFEYLCLFLDYVFVSRFLDVLKFIKSDLILVLTQICKTSVGIKIIGIFIDTNEDNQLRVK